MSVQGGMRQKYPSFSPSPIPVSHWRLQLAKPTRSQPAGEPRSCSLQGGRVGGRQNHKADRGMSLEPWVLHTPPRCKNESCRKCGGVITSPEAIDCLDCRR